MAQAGQSSPVCGEQGRSALGSGLLSAPGRTLSCSLCSLAFEAASAVRASSANLTGGSSSESQDARALPISTARTHSTPSPSSLSSHQSGRSFPAPPPPWTPPLLPSPYLFILFKLLFDPLLLSFFTLRLHSPGFNPHTEVSQIHSPS